MLRLKHHCLLMTTKQKNVLQKNLVLTELKLQNKHLIQINTIS
jgi:hypothetical protein